jgi:hypothetical protein
MASLNTAEVSPSLSARLVTHLVEQFSCLAEITEQLTYRLIYLEERLAEQQKFIMAIREQGLVAIHGLPLQEQLDQTDLRLAQIETLLGGKGNSASLGGLSTRPGVVTSPVHAGLAGLGSGQDGYPSFAEQVFPAESEQPFMDDDLELPIAG